MHCSCSCIIVLILYHVIVILGAIFTTVISFSFNKLLPLFVFQFHPHIKKKLAHITEYMFPHRHDNSHICRWHKFDQLPSCLSSRKCRIYTNSLFLLQACQLSVSFNCDVWQVGIALHYSSLSTLLWIGVSARVIYKEAVWRMPRQPEGESPTPPTQRPMLRSAGETQLTFTNFPYHEIGVCCQYGLCFGQMREFWCMATQTALHLSGSLYPTTIVPLFVRDVWRHITGVPVRHKKLY